jgi:hypothetical protein
MPTLILEDQFTTGGTWTASAGTPVIGSSPAPPDGGNSLECNAAGDYVYWDIPNSGYTRCVWGVWVYFDTFPATTTTHCFKLDSGPSEGWLSTEASGQLVGNSSGTPTIAGFTVAGAVAIDTWHWLQIMYDVSANPWEMRLNVNGTVGSGTGAAAASNLNPGIFLLGNTAGGNAYTVYFGHPKAGVAADDNDWWAVPSAVETQSYYASRRRATRR